MITDNDVKKLKTIFATKDDVEAIFDQKFDQHIEEIDQKLTQFRSDIFNKMDQVIGEIKSSREEKEVLTHQVSDHEDRLEVIEAKLQIAV